MPRFSVYILHIGAPEIYAPALFRLNYRRITAEFHSLSIVYTPSSISKFPTMNAQSEGIIVEDHMRRGTILLC